MSDSPPNTGLDPVRLVGRVFVALSTVAFAFPIYWTLNTALKPGALVNTFPPTLVPWPLQVDALVRVVTNDRIRGAVVDSLLVTGGTTALAMGIGTAAGYGLSRMRARTGQTVALALLVPRAVPQVALILPAFFILAWLGLDDSHLGLVILYLSFDVPLATWLMRGHFARVPRRFEEAAHVDGYSQVGTLRRVTLPLAWPGFAATTVLVWIFAWNEFLFAVILSGADVVPYTVLASMMGNNWTAVTALAVVVTLPPTLVLVTLRRHVVEGLTLGLTRL
jgi:multiple sugar transport system permease protein